MKKFSVIIGVVIFTLFCGGLYLKTGVDVIAKEKVIQINDEAEQSATDKKLADLEAKKKDLEAKEISLKLQKNEEFSNNGFTQRYYELSNELEDIADEIWDVEREISKLENSINLDEAVDIIDDITDMTENESVVSNDNSNKNSFFDIFFIIPIIMFVVVFVFIIISIVRSSKHMSMMTNSTTTKEMLNDLSDVAVKMAKDLNPTYKEFKCPNCNAALDPENTDIKKCNYCGAKIYKTVNIHNHSHNDSHKTK